MSIQKVPKSFYLALVELSGVLCLCLGHMREQLLSRRPSVAPADVGGGHHTPPSCSHCPQPAVQQGSPPVTWLLFLPRSSCRRVLS